MALGHAEQDDHDPHHVRPYLRIVPNGFVPGKPRRLRATLTLTPLGASEPSGYDLKTWPGDVAELLATGVQMSSQIFLRAVELGAGGASFDPSAAVEVDGVGAAKPEFVTRFGMERAALNGIWQNSICPPESQGKEKSSAVKNAAWKGLSDRINAVMTGARTTAGKIAQGKADKRDTMPNDVPDDAFGANGQFLEGPPSDRRSVDAILGIPHSDAALALEAQRAFELANSIAHDGIDAARPLPETSYSLQTGKWPGDPAAVAKARADFGDTRKGILKAAVHVPANLTEGEPIAEAIAEWESRFAGWFEVTADELDPWLKRHSEALSEARQISTAATLRKRKILRFGALSGMVDPQRDAARRMYVANLDALTDNSQIDHCSFTALSPGKAAEQMADALEMSRVQSELGLWEQHENPGSTDFLDDVAPRKVSALSATDPETHAAVEHAAQAYFAVHGSPGQARVFGLAIDIVIDLPPELTGPFIALSATVDGQSYGPQVPVPWTLTKIAAYDESADGLGWPAVLGEYLAWKAAEGQPVTLHSHCIAQYGGVIVMGGIPDAVAGGARVPRYDIATMDVASALEAERSWLEAVEEKRALIDADPSGPVAQELKRLLAVGPDYQSNGLTLLCRSAVADAVRKLAATTAKMTGNGGAVQSDGASGCCVLIDAEDLTNGFRVFVGTPEKDGSTRWRSLMGRYFRYDQSGRDGRLVETLLQLAVGSAGDTARIALESAMTAIPARDMKSLGQGADPDAIEAFVEESVMQWDGTPGGVACAGLADDAGDVPDVMTYGRKSFIPSGDAAVRPPNLRFGRPYRFALQAVYAGGRGINLEDHNVAPKELLNLSGDPSADPVLEDSGDARARLFYPSLGLVSHADQSARPFVRALRHTRLGAPALLIPERQATRRNGPMGFESAGKMVVRTLRDVEGDAAGSRDRSRANPTISQRIVVVPHLPLAITGRHLVDPTREGSSVAAAGVLDRYEANRSGPPGGMPRIRYAPGRQGFPTVETSFRTGFDGESYILDRKIASGTADDPFADGKESASSVFQQNPNGAYRPTDYYPDPAADMLVIRARHVAGEAGRRAVLPGQPLAVELAPEQRPYPDRLPVLLSLRRDTFRDPDTPLTQDVLHHRGVKYVNPGRSSDIAGGGRIPMQAVDLLLAPGEQIDLEMWLVPSAWRLAHDLAVVQGLAQFLSNRGDAANGSCTRENLCAGIEKLFEGRPEKAERLKAVMEGVENPRWRYVGPGGDILPGTGVLTALGKELRREMLHHPLPEISAVRTVVAVHAVNRPKDARPKVTTLEPGTDPFPGRDHTTGDAGCLSPQEVVPGSSNPAPLRAVRPADLANPVTGFSDASAIATGAKTIALTGEVALDLAKIDTIEITARTVSPDTAIFDNERRGRSLAHRLAGTWPDSVGREELRSPREVFGFRVARDGRVKLIENVVTLIRIESLPLPQTFGKASFVDLGCYFMGDDGDAAKHVSLRHQFPDGKARRLGIRVNGLARTAEYLTTAARVAVLGDPWLSGSGLVYERNELVPAERLDPRWMRNLNEHEVEVMLPATVRPAMVDAKAPVPAFELALPELVGDDGALILRQTRHAAVRLRMRRGWFSSGVDERLGIVLWPPDQILADQPDLVQNRLTLRPRADCPEPDAAPPRETRVVELDEFSDEDLGPGGQFVTRRATDPVRMADVPTELHERQIFLSKESFVDIWRHPSDPGRATYVPHVLMPLADAEEDSATEAGPASDTDATVVASRIDTTPPMAVGLVTYEPRFDMEREEWFADVMLLPGRSADSFVRFGLVRYQPHTRPDLRCSRPVAQFAQPLPERRVTVICRPGADHVELRVAGPISVGRALETAPRRAGNGSADTEEEHPFTAMQRDRNRPFLRVSAFRDAPTPTGAAGRDPVLLNAADLQPATEESPRLRPDGTIELRPRIEDGEGVWETCIALSLLERHGWQLKLSLEEIEYFLPSDFGSEEPLDPDHWQEPTDDAWRETGARFATVLDLSALAPAMTGGD